MMLACLHTQGGAGRCREGPPLRTFSESHDISASCKCGFVLDVPEGQHPGGTTLPEALRGNLHLRRVLRGLCGGLSEGCAGLSRIT